MICCTLAELFLNKSEKQRLCCDYCPSYSRSKSANYCYATAKNPWGLLLLCEVALGQENLMLAADYNADQLPKGKHSVKGCGEIEPDPANAVTMDDGETVVPMGPGVKSRERQSLIYNEYIVYKTDQVRLRYIAKIKFNFK